MKNIMIILGMFPVAVLADIGCYQFGNITSCTNGVSAYQFGNITQIQTPYQPRTYQQIQQPQLQQQQIQQQVIQPYPLPMPTLPTLR